VGHGIFLAKSLLMILVMILRGLDGRVIFRSTRRIILIAIGIVTEPL